MINKKIHSVYGIFKNKNTNKTIVYYPCPKNANTSAKLFFLRLQNKKNFFLLLTSASVQFVFYLLPNLFNRNIPCIEPSTTQKEREHSD